MVIPEITSSTGNTYKDFSFFTKGGMGEIYKGIEAETDKEIILKLVSFGTDEEENLLQTEFDTIKQFSHQNIAQTLQTGKINISGTRYLYMIQKFYPAGNLRPQIKKGIPFDQCFKMMMDILNGMKEIHTNVVHRDLKPENILVNSDGRLLITDFGLAKYIDEKTRTRSFKGAGTLPYMSPECWSGDPNTISMDIYSLGIIFYEIITGELPYSANTEIEWRECHLFEAFPSVVKSRENMTVKVDQIIQKMTNKRVHQRYKSIDEIISALVEAKSINDASNKEAERLAQMGNLTLRRQKEQELKQSKKAKKTTEQIKFLNFEITELFNRFTAQVAAINDRLEDAKINIQEQSPSGSTKRTLTLSFRGKRIVINFSNYDEIDRNDAALKQASIQAQRQKYDGILLSPPQDSYLKSNNFVLLGLAETSFKIGNNEYGFNLLLKKQEESNYGDWYILQFSKNITPPETNFGLTLSIFFNEFNQIHHSPYHQTTIREINEADISSLLEKIL